MNDLKDYFPNASTDFLNKNSTGLDSEGINKVAVAKYHNQPVIAFGERFGSGKEAARAQELVLQVKAHAIFGLRFHVRFPIVQKTRKGERTLFYECDAFYCEMQGSRLVPVIEDTKTEITKTRLYKLKKRLMKQIYGIEIREVSWKY